MAILFTCVCIGALLCAGLVSALGQDMHDHAMQSMPPASTASSPPCVTNSTMDSCKDYVYPSSDIEADNMALCSAMPFMTACSARDTCARQSTDQKMSTNHHVCDGFQLLATTCAHDTGMSHMRGCTNYNTLCAQGSKVAMCSSHAPLTFLPTTRTLNDQVKSICTEMTMDGCEKCTPSWDKGQTFGNCSLLEVYAQLCSAMPTMGQCWAWKDMCQADSSLYLCPGSGGGTSGSGSTKAPVMKMYFNSERPFYLLFKSWTPSTTSAYAGAWFAIFFLAIGFEALQMLRRFLDLSFKAYVGKRCCSSDSNNACCAAGPSLVNSDGQRAVKVGQGMVDGGQNAVKVGQSPVKFGQHSGSIRLCCGGGDVEEPAASMLNSQEDVYGADGKAAQIIGENGQTFSPNGQTFSHNGQIGTQSGQTGQSRQLFGQRFCRVDQRAVDWKVTMMYDLLRACLLFCSVGVSYLLMLAAMSFNVGIFFAVPAGIAVGSFVLSKLKLPTTPVGESDDCCMV